ncbi:hypothetical protein A3K72_03585 [Candidatus Woesearchaeota archaeon RBG_13_36_6]|nr:MAG: hypothetical protein A3K72_03585 [Candidatus Woesearchaeota archaeon RBG_13_36_6]
MRIYIEREDKKSNIKFEGKVSDLLKRLKTNPETVVVVKNNKVVTQEDKLSNKDNVEILSVISGG